MSSKSIVINHQISSSIIDIIREAKRYCFIITPYFKTWPQLSKSLELAASQNKKIFFLFRDDQKYKEEIIELNERFNFDIFFIENLHAKIYLNESTALISSMNLYDYSKENNFEIGYIINNPKDLKEIVNKIISEMINVWGTNCLYGNHSDYLSQIIYCQNQNTDSQFKSIKQQKCFDAFCIRCKRNIRYDFYKPLCSDCFFEWNRYHDNECPENYCHKCGNKNQSTYTKPLCLQCFLSMSNCLLGT
ncbi:hypothetical protein HRO26_01180 [Treponema pectinovorum]|uniref:phospholipase D-like domain-containing protein n=1 Tax=Treponema pectinovorum TaxID=164 RepID=UPI003D91431B